MYLAIPDKSAFEIANFLFKNIYCRYLVPGDCLIHDRDKGLCANINKIMHEGFGTDVNVSSAYRPQANGQAEAYVKKVKTKLISMLELNCNCFLFDF